MSDRDSIPAAPPDRRRRGRPGILCSSPICAATRRTNAITLAKKLIAPSLRPTWGGTCVFGTTTRCTRCAGFVYSNTRTSSVSATASADVVPGMAW